MKKIMLSLALLISVPALVAGKPINNRHALILAAENGDIETVRRLVENGLVTHRTMNTAIAVAYSNNLAKITKKVTGQTEVIEFLFDNGALYEGQAPYNYAHSNKKTIKLLLNLGALHKRLN